MKHIVEANLHLSKDKVLKKIVGKIDLGKRKYPTNIYHSLLSSIISQQLSTKAASTIKDRFFNLFPNGKLQPQLVLKTSEERLRSAGLSSQKLGYIKSLSEYFINQPQEKAKWSKKSDEEIIQELTSIKGIGKWTVQMLLMFTLDRSDVLPVDDLIIRNKIVEHYKITSTGKVQNQDIEIIAEKWKPFRSYACYYFWASKDLKI